MEIHLPHPLFFLHIPKTAGTTLNKILDNNLSPENILDLYTEDQHAAIKETTYDQISEYALVRGHVFMADFADVLDGPVPFRVFAFLRDPIERVISEYYFLKRWPKSHLYIYLNENNVSLAEYITSEAPMLKQRGRNNMMNSLSGVIQGTEDDRLALAWHHLKDRFLTFGILERFDESLLMLKRHAGLENVFYEKQNVRAVNADRPVSAEEMDIIHEYNQMDIKLYELAMEEFSQRVELLGPSFRTEVRMFGKVNERFQRVSDLVNRNSGVQQGALINSK